MRKLLALSTFPHRLFVVIAMLFVASSLFFLYGFQASAADAADASKRIITIHDRGKEVGLLTEAHTLRDALDEANISLDKNDMVEPGLDEKLVAQSYEVNIYRARPVVIVDGVSTKKVLSAYQTPSQIVREAGVPLRDEDIADIQPVDNIISEGASVKVVIDHALPVRLELYGDQATIYTQAETVGGLLREKGIKLKSNDKLSLPESTPVTPDMKLAIWRDGKQTITRKESIKFPVVKIEDADRPVGYRKIQSPGKNGQKMVTYEAVMKNGKIVKKKQIQSVVLKQPVKQVEVVGTKISLPAGSHEDWMASAGLSSADFGYANAIFSQESGWNPAAYNPAGYVGLGQTSEANLSGACPNWRSDPICQIRFFDGYATSRYGSWRGAYVFKFGSGGSGGHGWW